MPVWGLQITTIRIKWLYRGEEVKTGKKKKMEEGGDPDSR